MDLQQRINAFVKLGEFLSQFSNNDLEKNKHPKSMEPFVEGFVNQMELVKLHNGWFTQENILFALENWSKALNIKNFKQWLDKYNFKDIHSKKVAIVMAGNIPLVGFHDFMSVLISGHLVLVKQSSNDKHLLPYLAKYLEAIEPGFKGKIEFTENKLEHFDAVIATGSNNTARHFEYYFKGRPSIIRKNRNSVAILTGDENDEDLRLLSEDIFRYFGLGCRNVSKLFIPINYDFQAFFNAMYDWNPIINHNKYANNYDYNKAVYLMSEFNILDNGFLMLKEDEGYASPISTVFYEYYESIDQFKSKLETDKDSIQCIVSKHVLDSEISFGKTQKPELWDYADNVDTIEFLLKI
jgi:hypothetical protein